MVTIFSAGYRITFTLLFGEVLPKVYANNNALAFTKFMVIPLAFLEKYSNLLALYSLQVQELLTVEQKTRS